MKAHRVTRKDTKSETIVTPNANTTRRNKPTPKTSPSSPAVFKKFLKKPLSNRDSDIQLACCSVLFSTARRLTFV